MRFNVWNLTLDTIKTIYDTMKEVNHLPVIDIKFLYNYKGRYLDIIIITKSYLDCDPNILYNDSLYNKVKKYNEYRYSVACSNEAKRETLIKVITDLWEGLKCDK